MSCLVLDCKGTVRDHVLAPLQLEDFGPVRLAGSVAELVSELAGAQAHRPGPDAVIVDLPEDPDLRACKTIRATG